MSRAEIEGVEIHSHRKDNPDGDERDYNCPIYLNQCKPSFKDDNTQTYDKGNAI